MEVQQCSRIKTRRVVVHKRQLSSIKQLDCRHQLLRAQYRSVSRHMLVLLQQDLQASKSKSGYHPQKSSQVAKALQRDGRQSAAGPDLRPVFRSAPFVAEGSRHAVDHSHANILFVDEGNCCR